MDFFFINSTDFKLASDIGNLYNEAGWWEQAPSEPDMVKRVVEGSYCFVVAKNGSSIVGMGRAISDGVSDAYVQDIAVLPVWRGQGVAGTIVKMIINRLQKDGIDWIGIVAERGTHKLYENLGFEHIPNSKALFFKAKPNEFPATPT